MASRNIVFVSVIISVILGLFLIGFVSAVDDLLALQGNVLEGGSNLDNGNLTVVIFDAYSSGNIIYNSTNDFHGSINSGKYDVMLGNGSQELSLEYGKVYYMEVYINTEKLSFNGSSRQVFQSSVGNVSLKEINGYSNIFLTNQSNTISAGNNITTSSGGWFKGLFNWLIAPSSNIYLSFNGSTLSFDESQLNTTIDRRISIGGVYNQTYESTFNSSYALYAYNQTYSGSTYNATYALYAYNQTSTSTYNVSYALYAYNQTSAANTYTDSRGFITSTIANNTYLNFTPRGQVDFNGGWQGGGLSVINGNLFAQTLYVYNITSLAVNNLNVNATIIPGVGFDGQFDIGNETLRWRNAYFTGLINTSNVNALNVNASSEVYVNGVAVSTWLYNQTSSNTYNVSYALYAYNQTIPFNPFNQDLNTTNNVAFSNITSAWNVTSRYLDVRRVGGTGINFASFGGSANANEGVVFSQFQGIRTVWFDAGSNVVHNINTGGNATFNNTLYVVNSGNVGIGTSNPANTLNVVGTANITGGSATAGLIVDSGGLVGIGTDSSSAKLEVASATSSGDVGIIQATASGGEALILRYNESDNFWKFRTSGTARPISFSMFDTSSLWIATDGNVGIGTSSPGATLDLGTNVIENKLSLYQSGGGSFYGFGLANGKILVRTNNATVASFLSGGNVGIGTETPSAPLEVGTYFNVTSTAIRFGAGGFPFQPLTAGSTQGLAIGQQGVNVGRIAVLGGASADLFLVDNGAATNSKVFALVNDDGQLYFARRSDAGTTTNLAVLNLTSGNVGIGTSSPGALLDLMGTTGNQLRLSYNSDYYWKLERNSTGKFHIINHQSAPDIIPFTIDTSGNVGIGTSNPTSTLDVNGNFSANSTLYVTSAGRVGIGTSTPSNQFTVSGTLADIAWEDTTSGEDDFVARANGDYLEYLSGSTRNILVLAGDTKTSGAGYVGIGTSTPSQVLTVNGNALINASSAPQLIVGDGGTVTTARVAFNSPNSAASQQQLQWQQAGTARWTIYRVSNDDKLRIYSHTNAADLIGITPTGFGIGTITPTQKLEVAGNVNISNHGSNLTLGNGAVYWDNPNSRLVIKVT